MDHDGWTTQTLFLHFTALREADLRASAAVDAANIRALQAALASNDKRLDGLNEFRETVEDVNKNSLTRKEALTFLAGLIASAGTFALIYSVFT